METSEVTSDVLLTKLFIALMFHYIVDDQSKGCEVKCVCHEPYGKS